jgi:hypothetical protein
MALAENTLRIQLIVLRIELERYIVLLLVGHHEVQVFAARAAYESGLARIESQDIHSNPMVLMKDCTASLLTHPTGVADDAARARETQAAMPVLGPQR